ncbi:hypothetical protein WA026_013789 [Henosepilachna vigintioctopunctata]|uniref:Uncharacterized protein n=1 Tax=Henosepilachna vigintioctopunctata TaxID=420089 RepID=A0AAW1UXV3_9CUCU
MAYLHILVTFGILHIASTSDCDVEFVYSDYFNSNGFKVTCKDIEEGQENIIRSIAAHNALILLIRNASLANITSNIFENVPKIKELSIEDSEILINGQVDPFSKLELLQKLNLKNTKLMQIGNGTFKNLLQLKFLHLENNSVNMMSKDSLKSSSLEIFEFISNELDDIEDIPLCDIPNIRVINFKKNKLKYLRPDLYQCSVPIESVRRKESYEDNHYNVETIDLSDNEISSLDGAFKSFKNLEHLHLENNLIGRITDTDFEKTNEMSYLNLSNNSISSISSAAFGTLYKLKQLDLSRNKIAKIKLEFLSGLSEVYLAHNELTFESINSINRLPHLEILDLSFNKLKGTSKIFSNFPSLVTLNLEGNNLILENDMFTNLTQLEKLSLSNNGIIHIPDLIFNRTTSLVELNLSNNKLESLDYNDVFSSLTNLQILDLSRNNLMSLSYLLFVKLDNVETLDIAGNKLKTLDYSLIITNMRALSTVNIKDNYFSCNFLHRVVKYFSWKGINYRADNITHYDEENIGGINCKEDVFPEAYNTVQVSPSTKSNSVFIIILVSAVFSVFVLLLIVIFKYYQFHRRRKYQCDQFELIED